MSPFGSSATTRAGSTRAGRDYVIRQRTPPRRGSRLDSIRSAGLRVLVLVLEQLRARRHAVAEGRALLARDMRLAQVLTVTPVGLRLRRQARARPRLPRIARLVRRRRLGALVVWGTWIARRP